ncbi:helix-turn-helix domain-containing protein [Flavilitoribacter nigricans]|uniref:Adenylate/guanylate cyclase domain-containing protein n=1 Tax=Flavilitoribacter nigricans (strain ATCC 23147 / DSM 23189 / NBRC 102662 / NCIMB 1420 / SS-2) TaxID=1122177 RepID=A0A2D0NJK5_FLAN2|nr:adenylate/guanylate cyclase domain-containing protein [Flavilitoribacter nigricans]PHN08637.1 adenylate/guanylate cyclase domain-containing protein [Flavilitoribacter nigricans DSM 23189 = NBRC 102662]
MPAEQKTRRLAAIMFTDIVGYTAIMQQDEARATALRVRHRDVFEQQHRTYNGEILQYFGDGSLSIFQSGVEAVSCAIAIQKALSAEPAVPLRVGLHVGDIVYDGTEIYGDSVNVASRIESMGVAGAILISGNLDHELKNHPHISTVSLGHFEFKNVDNPLEVFAVSNRGIIVPERSALKGKQKQPSKSIAVLPFVNMSAREENEYFSDGMTEEIINALTKIKNLKVTSRTSSFFFKGKNIPIPEIGRELNVSTVLEGSIRLAGNRMRITAQLIDVAEDYHFWSETFDRSLDDIFAVQDEISLLIADKLREQIGHLDIEDHLVEAPKVSVDGYKRYLKGHYHLLKMTKADLDEGLAIMEEILEEQPDFALAHLGMHQGYTMLGSIGLIPAEEGFAKGKPHLEKAIELEPDLPECQLNLAWISFLQDWDLEATYLHLNKVQEIRPIVDYYQSMASILVAEKKFAAAHHYIDIAMQMDPFSEINFHLKGFIHYCEEQFETAITCFEKGLALNPGFQVSMLYWGCALIGLDRKKDCLEFYRKLPEDNGDDLLKLGGMTIAHAALGNEAEVSSGIKRLEAALSTSLLERAMNILIFCRAVQGNHDVVLNLLEQAVNYHLPLIVYLYADPMLKPLWPDPRFQQLMKQVLGEATSFDLPDRKYKKMLFSREEMEQYSRKLEALMAEKQPYLDPNLSLRSLAELLDLPPNHMSQLLNEGFDQNFSEYINSYRLEAFKTKVADPAFQHLTLLGLAYECGFNSKTVFNTFFKKSMGKTPRAYWKEVVKQQQEGA